MDRLRDAVALDSMTIEVGDVRRSIEHLRSLGVVMAPARSAETFDTRRFPDFRVDFVVMPDAPFHIRLGVRCGSPSDVDRLVQLLGAASHRVRRGPADEAWGCRTALLVDPDGHLVELYAPYP